MKAILVERHGGPEVLRYTETKPPSPSEEQLLIDVSYVGVNYIDTYFRSGAYPSSVPYIPGSEGVGRVAYDPAGQFATGTVVAFTEAQGSYAEQTVVQRTRVVRVPPEIDEPVAASMLLQGMTAHYLTESVYRVTSDTSLVVTAGAGGVGLVLTQMAAARGAKIYSVVSTPKKAELALQAGATQAFTYAPDLASTIIAENGGVGVDVVYDGVGKDTFDFALDVCRPRGLVCSFGSASGDVEPFEIQRLNRSGSLFLTRPSLAAYTATDEEFQTRAQAVVEAVAAGKLKFQVNSDYPLAQAQRAHEDLQARATTGSVVLNVSA